MTPPSPIIVRCTCDHEDCDGRGDVLACPVHGIGPEWFEPPTDDDYEPVWPPRSRLQAVGEGILVVAGLATVLLAVVLLAVAR